MKRQHVLIWAAWVTHTVAWFLPVAAEGATFPHGLPFEHWYNAVFAAMSAATTPLLILTCGLCGLGRAQCGAHLRGSRLPRSLSMRIGFCSRRNVA